MALKSILLQLSQRAYVTENILDANCIATTVQRKLSVFAVCTSMCTERKRARVRERVLMVGDPGAWKLSGTPEFLDLRPREPHTGAKVLMALSAESPCYKDL